MSGLPIGEGLAPTKKFFPDGLAIDENGTVWIADYPNGAVVGMSPDGELVDSIEVPSTMVTSVCFGGADRRDLYIVTANNTEDAARQGTIFRTRVEVPGLAAPLAGSELPMDRGKTGAGMVAAL